MSIAKLPRCGKALLCTVHLENGTSFKGIEDSICFDCKTLEVKLE